MRILANGGAMIGGLSSELKVQQPVGEGEMLVFSHIENIMIGRPYLYLIDDVNGIRRIGQTNLSYGRPVWSPDGAQLVYTSEHREATHYYLVGADGSDRRQITSDDYYRSTPKWSPDSTRLAYLAFQSGEPALLHITEVTTRETRQLPVENVEDFVWMPDSRSLLIIVHTDASVFIEIYNIDGTHNRSVGEATYLRDAAYITISPDVSKVAYVAPSRMGTMCF